MRVLCEELVISDIPMVRWYVEEMETIIQSVGATRTGD